MGRTKCCGVTWRYKLCVLHGFCTNINFPVCLFCCSAFHKREVEKHFVVCKNPVERQNSGVTLYMLCEVTRQLCYRALVLGLVQCPADFLAWRTMSRTQAFPQRGQGSKDTGFFSVLPKTFTSCIMCQLSVVLCRGRRAGERGGYASLQPV